MTASPLALKLALVAIVLYVVHDVWSRDDDTVIRVPATLVDRIAAGRESLLGRALTDDERAGLRDGYIVEEILVREALARGVDRSDPELRRWVIEHARRQVLQSAGYQPPMPAEHELRAYFDAHADRYRASASVDIQQVSLPPGAAPELLERVRIELERGVDFTTIGAAAPADAEARAVTRSRMAHALGLELAREVFALPANVWHGPFPSTVGTHFFRITERRPGRDLAFDDVRDEVESDFLHDAADRAVDEELERIRNRYRVILEEVD